MVWQVKSAVWVVTVVDRRTQSLTLAGGGRGVGAQCGHLYAFSEVLDVCPQIGNLGF